MPCGKTVVSICCRSPSQRSSRQRKFHISGRFCRISETKNIHSNPVTHPSACLSFKDIPGPSPSLPLIGTGWQYFPLGRYNLSNLHEATFDKYHRYGDVVKEEFQWKRPVVQLYQPKDFEIVFHNQGKMPIRPISEFLVHYRKQNPEKYDSAGIANMVGEEWYQHRQMLSPVLLQLDRLDNVVPPLNNICNDFMELIRNKRNKQNYAIENLQQLAYRFSLEAIYMMTLESRLGCLKKELTPDMPAFSMILAVQMLFEAFHELYFGLPLWKYFKTKSYQKLDKAESIIYNTAHNRIRSAMEQQRMPGYKPESNSVLQTLLQTKGLRDKEIIATIIDLISGGIFTVSNAFSFLLYHISRNPEVQEKLYQEVKKHAPNGEEDEITSDQISKMRYLHGCVKESFRLTPTIPCVARILTKDIILSSGYHVPAGIPLFCNFMVPCKSPERYPQPEAFQPDRWFDKTRRVANAFTLFPFGSGPRMCVGRRFAEMEIYTALAKIILNFRLESTGQEVICKQAFIVVPSHPVSIIFKDRHFL